MNPYFFRAVAWRAFSIGSITVAGFLSLRLYSRYLTPEIYGVVLVAMQIMAYLPLLDGGFRTVVNRRILAETNREEKLRVIRFGQIFYSWFALLVILAAALCMVAYSFFLHTTEAGQSAAFFLSLGLASALSVLSSAQMGLLVGLQAQPPFFVLLSLNAGFGVGALWLSLRAGAGVWAFPISSLMPVGGTSPLALCLIRVREPAVRFFRFRVDSEFWKYFSRLKAEAWACFTSQIAIMVLFSVDIVFVGEAGPRFRLQ